MFEQLERVALSGGGLYLKNWSKSIRTMPKLSFSTSGHTALGGSFTPQLSIGFGESRSVGSGAENQPKLHSVHIKPERMKTTKQIKLSWFNSL